MNQTEKDTRRTEAQKHDERAHLVVTASNLRFSVLVSQTSSAFNVQLDPRLVH